MRENGLISICGLKSEVTFAFFDPDFLYTTKNFSDSQTFEAVMGLFMFAQIFRTYWPKIGLLGGNKARNSGAILTPKQLVLTFGGYSVCVSTCPVAGMGHRHGCGS